MIQFKLRNYRDRTIDEATTKVFINCKIPNNTADMCLCCQIFKQNFFSAFQSMLSLIGFNNFINFMILLFKLVHAINTEYSFRL